MKNLYIFLLLFAESCTATENYSDFGLAYHGKWAVSEEGAEHLVENLDSGLVEGAILEIDKQGCLFFTDRYGNPLASGLDVINDGFFGFMAAYYIIVKAENPDLVGKKFGISALRGVISITDIASTKPEGKPDPLYDITGGRNEI